MSLCLSSVWKLFYVLLIANSPRDGQLVWPGRRSAIVRNDIHEGPFASVDVLCPSVFDDATGTSIDAEFSRKMVEPVAWPVAARSDKMTAVITRFPIGTSGLRKVPIWLGGLLLQ